MPLFLCQKLKLFIIDHFHFFNFFIKIDYGFKFSIIGGCLSFTFLELKAGFEPMMSGFVSKL